MKNSMEIPQKVTIELPYDPVILLLSIYPEKMKTLIRKDLCTPCVIAVSFTIAKRQKQPKYPSAGEWTNKKVAYSCNRLSEKGMKG